MSLTISALTPSNGTIIPASASSQFTLNDASVSAFAGCQVTLFVAYPSGVPELVYTTAAQFTALYGQGSVAPALSLALPETFTITRSGGWPGDPTFTLQVADTAGNTLTQSWSYELAQVPVLAAQIQASVVAASSFGTDVRAFAPLPDGTLGVDPFFLLVSDPNVVMPETIGRIISMAPGTLWYAPSQGYDSRSLINKQTNGDFTGVQSAIAQAVQRDDRFTSASCLVTPGGGSAYGIAVRGIGGNAPFSFAYSVANGQVQAINLGS